MNILIVKTSAIGDVIHTLPCLNALRRQFPEARIDWLVEEAAADAVIDHPAVNRVLISKRRNWVRDLKAGKLASAYKGFKNFVRELRSTEYDLLIDFQSLLKSGIFVGLAKAKRKVGYGRGMEHAECSYVFLNERVPPVDMDQHAVIRELQLLKAIGIDSNEIVFNLSVSELERREVNDLLAQAGVTSDDTLVAINPMTTWKTKHWLNDRFAIVADRLAEQGMRVAFTGGPQDVDGVGRIIAAMHGKAVNFAGRTTLKSLAALYQRAALLITTDTGPMHMAAAVDTPVVAIFGPTAPWRTGPFGSPHKVLRVEMECSPCLKKSCARNHECMEEITVDQVVETSQAILSGGL